MISEAFPDCDERFDVGFSLVKDVSHKSAASDFKSCRCGFQFFTPEWRDAGIESGAMDRRGEKADLLDMHMWKDEVSRCTVVEVVVRDDKVVNADTVEAQGLCPQSEPSRMLSSWTQSFKDRRPLSIPDSVTHIGVSVFKGCSSLTDVAIPESS